MSDSSIVSSDMLFPDIELWLTHGPDSSSNQVTEEGMIEAWSWIDSVDSWMEDMNNDNSLV